MSNPSAVLEPIDYPETDGKPLWESDNHAKPIVYARQALSFHFRRREDVYVSGTLLVYYVEGDPRRSVAPDVFVVLGVAKHRRRTYRIWEEGKGPDWVLEVTSKSTHDEDQYEKRELYARLGVGEYFQYDPTSDYLDPALQALRLEGDDYVAIDGGILADGTLSIRSETLGLDFRLEEGELRIYDPSTNELLLTYEEANDARRIAERIRRKAEQGQREAEQAQREAEHAQRDAEIALRAAEQARTEADEQFRREAQARQAAEVRIAELEARLKNLDAPS